MFGIDARSVVLITGLMGLLMAVVLYFLRRNYPPSIQGLGEWAAAPAVLFVATLLFGARGAIPNVFSIVLANLLLFGGTALFYFGSQRFFGIAPTVKFWSGAILAIMLPFSWFALVEPHYAVRLGIITLFMATLTSIHCRLILARGPRTFSSYFTAAALGLLALTQALRFVYNLSTATTADVTFDNATPGQAMQLSIYAFAILAQTIGYVLMATDRLHGELEHLATRDSLTGALVRRALIEISTRELARCRRNRQVMSLLLIDLDHFKAINDSHGHLMGDRVLAEFVTRVTPLLRQPDHFGRFGGEEFVALLPETSLAEARVVAERIRATMESVVTTLPACTVSIGVAASQADDAGLDAIIARADAAMYRAKAAGRNRVVAQ